jgi:hypothetical protein
LKRSRKKYKINERKSFICNCDYSENSDGDEEEEE